MTQSNEQVEAQRKELLKNLSTTGIREALQREIDHGLDTISFMQKKIEVARTTLEALPEEEKKEEEAPAEAPAEEKPEEAPQEAPAEQPQEATA